MSDLFTVAIGNHHHTIVVKEFNGQRVVTFKDIDELHKRPEGTARRNFNENKHRLIINEDYFVRNSYEAREEFNITAPNGLVLITEQGYLMLVKSFTDDLAWVVQRQLVTGYFRAKGLDSDLNSLSPQLRLLINMEIRQNRLEEIQRRLERGFTTLTDNLTSIPDPAKVVDLVNEYARWTRLGHNEVYNRVYDIMKDRYGIDVQTRVQNERDKLNHRRIAETGRPYAVSTLKKMVNGIDVMVRMGVLDKFHEILVGMLAKVKSEQII
jgi:hypothetical protein